MGKLKNEEYNFPEVTQLVNGSGMQTSQKVAFTYLSPCTCLCSPRAGPQRKACYGWSLHFPALHTASTAVTPDSAQAFLFDSLYCTSNLKLLLAVLGHSSNRFTKFLAARFNAVLHRESTLQSTF